MVAKSSVANTFPQVQETLLSGSCLQVQSSADSRDDSLKRLSVMSDLPAVSYTAMAW